MLVFLSHCVHIRVCDRALQRLYFVQQQQGNLHIKAIKHVCFIWWAAQPPWLVVYVYIYTTFWKRITPRVHAIRAAPKRFHDELSTFSFSLFTCRWRYSESRTAVSQCHGSDSLCRVLLLIVATRLDAWRLCGELYQLCSKYAFQSNLLFGTVRYTKHDHVQTIYLTLLCSVSFAHTRDAFCSQHFSPFIFVNNTHAILCILLSAYCSCNF